MRTCSTVFNFCVGCLWCRSVSCTSVGLICSSWRLLSLNVVMVLCRSTRRSLSWTAFSLLDRSPATAVRDGKSVEVPMEQLVEGDVVILKRGDQVPADAVVLTSDSLELDESC